MNIGGSANVECFQANSLEQVQECKQLAEAISNTTQKTFQELGLQTDVTNTTSTTISGLSTGTYNYTVTNLDGCTSSASASIGIISQPATPSAPSASTTIQPTCLALGTVVVSAPLGTNYEYSN